MKGRDNKMEKKKLSVSTGLCYAGGDVGCNIVFGMIGTLLTLFYTDYVGISAATVGLVMLLSRCFDGFSDLVMGVIVERTNSKWGKSRPWLLWMSIPFALSAVLLFTVPRTTGMLQFLYLFVTYNFCTTICYTAINLPYGSLSSMMIRESSERDKLSVLRMGLSPLGKIVAATCTLPLVKLLGNDQAAWIKTMGLWVVIAMTLLLFCFLKCEETITTEQKKTVEKIPVLTHLKALVKNKYFWCVLVLWTVQVTHMTIIGTSLPYYCKYIFHNDSWMYSVLYFAETIVIILGAMVCPMFIKKWGKRNITLAGAVVAIAAQVCLMLNPNNFYYMFAITLIRSAGVAQLNATVFGMLGDVVEYSYWKNGFRQESMIFGGASLGFKVGSGIASAVITSLMTASGYISSQGADGVQPGSAISMIADIYKWGPVIIWVIAAIMLVIYKLDREMPQIAEELANREK